MQGTAAGNGQTAAQSKLRELRQRARSACCVPVVARNKPDFLAGYSLFYESARFRGDFLAAIENSRNFTLSRIKFNIFCRHHNLHCRQRKRHFVGDDGKNKTIHTDFEHCRQRKGHFAGDDEIAVGTAALRLICVCRLCNYLIIGYLWWRWVDVSLCILGYIIRYKC